MQMPWAGEELALLDREKLKDITALLSPTELENYQMRGSPVGQTLQRQLDGFEPSEQEYRDIYRLRAAAEMPVQPEVHLRPNKLVKYESVAMVMASAQRLGMKKIGLIGNEQFMR